MKRKTFLQRIAIGSGGIVLIPSVGILTGCEYEPVVRITLAESDVPFLNEIAETILPATSDFGGAKAAKVGEYLLTMYRDCMSSEEQQALVNGINELDARSSEQLQSSFIKADPSERQLLLEEVQSEAMKNPDNPHYLPLLKSLVIQGYFTSEIGMTKARNYMFVPGSYEGCIPYQKSDGVWAI